MNHSLLFSKEVAKYLDMNLTALLKLRKNGQLPAFKMRTGGVRYDRSVVENYKKAHATTTTN